MEKAFEKINKTFREDIKLRQEQNDQMKADLERSNQEYETAKYVIRGLTTTKRTDKVFTSVRESIKELESLIDITESERSRQ